MSRLPALHPFLFALFPVLFLYSQNALELYYAEVPLPALLSMSLAGVVLLAGRAIYRSWSEAAIVTSLGLLLFFSYGHLVPLLKTSAPSILGIDVARHRYMLSTWTILFLAGAYAVFRTERELRGASGFLNVASLAMVAMSLINIGLYEVRAQQQEMVRPPLTQAGSASDSLQPRRGEWPNIYYIVLDGYASSATLAHVFDYDNSEFDAFLRKQGFYVATQSHSNYPLTFLSLASSLNMRYLDSLSTRRGPEDKALSYELIENSRVMRRLRAIGYQFVHFNSGYRVTDDNRFADVKLCMGSGKGLSQLLLETTILRPLEDYLSFLIRHRHDVQRNLVYCTFDTLEDLATRSEAPSVSPPFFAFAHIVSPHPPFVFGPHGDPKDGSLKMGGLNRMGREIWSHKDLYLGQLQYINRRVKALIRKIADDRGRPPVVLLQADHGTHATSGWLETQRAPHPPDTLIRERTGILNAYHLPGEGCEDQFYESISPVNSFRVVLNCYFDAGLSLLRDRSYFSSYKQPYQFRDVTNRAYWQTTPGGDTLRERDLP